MNPTAIERAERDTIQEFPDAQKGQGAASDFWFGGTLERSDWLPAPYTRDCERRLRWYDRANNNTLWHGAKAGLIKKFASTPSQVKGGRNLTVYYDELLRYADFGAGQRVLKQKIANDYLVFNGGAYFEIIGPGDPRKPLTGRVTGIAALDSFACLPTGDPDYPVLYTDTKSAQHLLHRSRIGRLIDTPDTDQEHPGYGRSALWRAIGVVGRSILEKRYVVASLDDKPPPGMFLIGGITRDAWRARWAEFQQEQTADERPVWGKVVTFHGVDASVTPSVTPVSFSTPPEKFDLKVYVELDVHEFALAIGVDIQELWELTSGNLGSAGQSQVQHAKSQGKTYGEMLSAWELGMNNFVLPPALEYQHKVRDPYEAQERAQNAQTWVSAVKAAGDDLLPNERRRILANQIEAFADAILDEKGELIRLPDIDPQDPLDTTPDAEQDVTIDDTTPTGNHPPEPVTTADNTAPNAGSKDFDATRREFVADFVDLLGAANDTSRRRAGIVLRAQLSHLGRKAYDDGLRDGGVADGMDDDDRAAFAVWLAQQSRFVTNFLDKTYQDGLSEAQISQHADMWANVSLREAYQSGLASADRNGLYEWQLGLTEKHCVTCAAMNGQRHRMKDYVRKRILPGNFNLACHGFNCDCRLVKTSGRAAGRWAQTTETLSALTKE